MAAGVKLLVVAPHPDDISLAVAGLIQQTGGRNTALLHITAGDGFTRDAMQLNDTLAPSQADMLKLGQVRAVEAANAADILRVPPTVRYMLGFPDGCLMRVVTSGTVPVRSPHTGRAAVPYPFAYGRVPYTAQALKDELRQIIGETNPAAVAYPAPFDTNSDHRATGLAVENALGDSFAGQRILYLVHHDTYPGIGLDFDRTLSPGDDLPAPDQQVMLTKVQERTKEQAIRAHTSQMEALGPWLLAFVARNEPLWRG